ncbi:hypothetical protein [Ramlibacter tataouinensis]|uniref:Uncharacterized protein n=1 Tax=Ramlibacter tataouinensis (strain ATCC BAA-407 / DSM 14655 / LMG 21543 / TTB310) TaxID=365046 RepID=F5XZP9_RAMTT|nr:hypothetical protein [Ramlibacter tataouinensis]AEG92078.1 hypothetical protein Rta_09940 [Ramlibacter tataouinensis TTB310]
MTPELPVLRLGLAGFAEAAQERFQQLLGRLPGAAVRWEIVPLEEADAWWINGARTQQLADGTLRVASGAPGGRSLQLDLSGIDRPIAFGLPLAPRGLTPERSFDPESPPSVAAVLAQFETLLRPLSAQFLLASQILERETALGRGSHRVVASGRLLAIVNLQGDASVLATVRAADFEKSVWEPRPTSDEPLPRGFVRTTLSHLMWQYALRTGRDVLPARYRNCTLYFRRPPRLPQRLLLDSHLLLMRELAVEPATLEQLQRRTGLAPRLLERDLGALYLVGSVTSNARRVVWSPSSGRREGPDSGLPNGQDTQEGALDVQGVAPQWKPEHPPDMTAPAPIPRG